MQIREKKFINSKSIILCVILIVFLLLILSVFFSILNINNTNILNGISINNINVSGLSKEEAISCISEYINHKNASPILFLSENYTTTTSFDNLEVSYQINEAVNKAYNLGRSGNIFQNNFDILSLLINKKDIKLNIKFNNDKLNIIKNEINSNLSNKLIQSSYYIEDNNLVLIKGEPGEVVDTTALIHTINNVLEDLYNSTNEIKITTLYQQPNYIDIEKIYNDVTKEAQNAYYQSNPLKVYPEVIGVSFDKNYASNILKQDLDEYIIPLTLTYPKITINQLDINIFQNTLGYFSTKYDISNKDRTTNLELAASKINGTVLSPGETFSYNKIVGARTISSGYKEAKVYSNGQVVDGIGGGICQISSTIYNSAIYANLNIVERYNHQFITSYVPAGRDATVVYGAKDLKFTNNRSYPIKIEVKVSNGIVTCAIYGLNETTEYDIDFDIETINATEPNVIYENDPSIEIGKEIIKQKGSIGATLNVYKVLKQDGKIISREFLSQDNYKSLEKIIIKNKL